MKKIHIKPFHFLAAIVFVLVAAGLYVDFSLFAYNKAIHDLAHEYQPYSVASADGKYILRTIKTEDSTGVYASFLIRSAADETVLFNCQEKYRTVDLKTIAWINNSDNVAVESGDVGTVRYIYQNGNWARE